MSILQQIAVAPSTPAFIYDEQGILKVCKEVENLTRKSGCRFIFSIKSFAITDALYLMTSSIDGFSGSSLFEVMLARSVIGPNGTVHLTTPGFKPDEVGDTASLCDYITLNSLSQLRRFGSEISGKAKIGLRLNPQVSLIKDERYNPCRKYSKLGVAIDQVMEIVHSDPSSLREITGLHFHTNCDCTDFAKLYDTVLHIDGNLRPLLQKIDWINLGGGYLFDGDKNLDAFHSTIQLLQSKYNLEVFIEPGASIVRKSGYIVSSIIDLFKSDGKLIAVLDTTVNHMPEVFEYQFEPDVVGHVDGGRYEYVLAGCTCLAGDIFGEYAFNEPLEVGSRVIFSNAGAYTLVKAHMFNGVNLPSIYAYTQDGKLELKKQFGYEDFLSRCGGNNYVPL